MFDRSLLPLRGSRLAVLTVAIALAACDPLSFGSARRAEGGSILTLLDTDGRKIGIGDEERGALSSSDYVGLDGSYLEAWAFDGDEGETVSIDLISDEFDAYLYVVGPGFSDVMRDDDGGGACHARVEFSVLESGRFTVVVSSMSGAETGAYTLRISSEPRSRAAGSCGGVETDALRSLPTEGREIRLGQSRSGHLTGSEMWVESDRPVQAWALDGVVGETIVVRLESDDFDAFLYVSGPGLEETLTDDDGGTGLDSELTVTFPGTGRYVVGAAAYREGTGGSYTLTVTEPVDIKSLPTDGRQLGIGEALFGTLTTSDPVVDGRPVQVWPFEARAGQRVTIDLESDEFDSYLQVVGPGFASPLIDDDGGEGLDSRLTVEFPRSGTYRVIASSLGGDLGSYTLTVR